MTSPIKPPGGPKAPDAPSTGAAEGPGRSGDAFADALEASRAGTANDAVASVPPALGADAAAVVDRLVAEQLEGPLAAGLDAAGRKALEAHLRATLEDDPGFRALVEDAAGEP
ncbi:MAG: hypothetical protein AAF447_17995 [Myxococcota bacterium]